MADNLQGTKYAATAPVSALVDDPPANAQHAVVGKTHYLLTATGEIYELTVDPGTLVATAKELVATFAAGTVRSAIEFGNALYFVVVDGSETRICVFNGNSVSVEKTIATPYDHAEIVSDSADLYLIYGDSNSPGSFTTYRNAGAWNSDLSLGMPAAFLSGRGSESWPASLGGPWALVVGSSRSGEVTQGAGVKLGSGTVIQSTTLGTLQSGARVPVSGLVRIGTNFYAIAQDAPGAGNPAVPAVAARLWRADLSSLTWTMVFDIGVSLSGTALVVGSSGVGSMPTRGSLVAWRSTLFAYLNRGSDATLYGLYKSGKNAFTTWTKAFNVIQPGGAPPTNYAFFTLL